MISFQQPFTLLGNFWNLLIFCTKFVVPGTSSLPLVVVDTVPYR